MSRWPIRANRIWHADGEFGAGTMFAIGADPVVEYATQRSRNRNIGKTGFYSSGTEQER
jgi:hypothetical protein